MKTINRKNLLLAGLCAVALSLGTTVYAEKGAETLVRLNKSSPATTEAASAVAHKCANCTDTFVSIVDKGGAWHISFADTGRGLAPQQLEKIFEPFQSRFEGGTGFGLAIVYQILQAHGAKISVRSTPGKGAEFTVEIDSAGAEAHPAAEAVEPAQQMVAAKVGAAHG